MPTATRSSYEEPVRNDGIELSRAAPQSYGSGLNQNNSEHSGDFNEDEDDNAIFRGDHEAHEEHMVTQKEDSWVKTFAGVAGNVLEWYDFAVFGYFSGALNALLRVLWTLL
jgi:hypothetical protein